MDCDLKIIPTKLYDSDFNWILWWAEDFVWENSVVMTFTEANMLYLCIKFSTFPGTCFKIQTSKRTWKGSDIYPLPIYTWGKWSNVVHIIW